VAALASSVFSQLHEAAQAVTGSERMGGVIGAAVALALIWWVARRAGALGPPDIAAARAR
jgi:hypothetical protein